MEAPTRPQFPVARRGLQNSRRMGRIDLPDQIHPGLAGQWGPPSGRPSVFLGYGLPSTSRPESGGIGNDGPPPDSPQPIGHLAAPGPRRHRRRMFSISDKDIAAIQAAFEQGGQLSATIEVRRIFPGIPDNAAALRVALTVAGWEPVSPRER